LVLGFEITLLILCVEDKIRIFDYRQGIFRGKNNLNLMKN
jgi:hypothetical protein